MKKFSLFFTILALISCLKMSGQIQMDCNGKVGIGGITPTTRLHIKDASPVIRLQNDNNYLWNIGNYTSDIWGHTNALTISDNTGYPFLIFSSANNEIYCNRNFLIDSWGAIHRNYTGWGGHSSAGGYDFNPYRANEKIGFIFENNYYEGSGFYGDQDYAVIWSPGDYGYLLKVLDEDGMSSGTELKWYINGSGQAYTNSDKSRKKNIENIESSINKIKKLRGVSYNFIETEEEKQKNDSVIKGLIPYTGEITQFKKKMDKKDYGFIAQELEETIPEVVETDETGNKYVNYDGIIPLLLEGMKEQQLIIDSLHSEIQELKKNIVNNDSKLKSASLPSGNEESHSTENILYQNTPNPFSQSTTIEYSIAENVQNAMICIYNMNGTQLKCIPLNLTGYGNITFNGSELKAGMYMYTLIADGQVVDTKQMILTD